MNRLKALLLIALVSFGTYECNQKQEKGKFTISGEIKNAPDQKIYLEQLFFSQKNPEVLDTAEIKNGKFSLSAVAPEEGLYRLRLEKVETGYIFINDNPEINFKADIKDISINGPDFNTPANHLFKNFITSIDTRRAELMNGSIMIDSLKKIPGSDSLINLKTNNLNELAENFKNFILKSVDTLQDPVVAMFALGYTQNIDPSLLKQPVANLVKRFPQHQGIASLQTQFNQMQETQAQAKQTISNKPTIGNLAPDFTMNDTDGKPFSLSQLKGKYVLVDFWASWCGPCRGENPNVVIAYNKFKNKNFTVLGVSLDENKAAWLKAIKDDKLEWKQVSDLKQWNSAAVGLYGFDGIPYNVLIDPQGKIIGTELRGEDLEKKLGELL